MISHHERINLVEDVGSRVEPRFGIKRLVCGEAVSLGFLGQAFCCRDGFIKSIIGKADALLIAVSKTTGDSLKEGLGCLLGRKFFLSKHDLLRDGEGRGEGNEREEIDELHLDDM